MKKQRGLSEKRETRLFNLINACFEKYSEEEMIEMFNKITDKDYQDKKDEEEAIIELEGNGYTVLKLESLAEVIKFEAFKEQLEANPYQLNIAI